MHSDLNRTEQEAELKEKLSTVVDDETIVLESTVKYDEDPEYPSDNSRNEPESLHFLPGVQKEVRLYIQFLPKKLKIHRMVNFDCLSSVELLREELKRQVIIQRRVTKLLVSQERDLLQDQGIFCLIDAVPCLLHAKN